MSQCTHRQDEADLLVRGHLDVSVHVELGGLDVAPCARNLGVQQGQGNSPTLFTTLVETLLWRHWDKAARAKGWGIKKVGDAHTPRVTWAGDNILAAGNVFMLRAMLREMDRLLEGCGMSAGWGDPEKCAWIASDPRTPEELDVGGATINTIDDLRILGTHF